MNNIPSKSLSKPLLIITPLFLIIMCVLNTSNQISYLFVLDFVNNMLGKSDIMFIPTTTPQIHSNDIYRQLILKNNGIQVYQNIYSQSSLPLINMSIIDQWTKGKELVRGVTARWLVPVVANNNVDSLIMVINIKKQVQVGMVDQLNIQTLNKDQIAIPQELQSRLKTTIGSSLKINLSIKNLFNGLKLIEKVQDPNSNDEYTIDTEDVNLTKVTNFLYDRLPKDMNLTKDQIQKVIGVLYESTYEKQYKIKYIYKENGVYPAALHNVIVMEYEALAQLMVQFVKENIVMNRQLNIRKFLPVEYRTAWDLAILSNSYVSQGQKYLTNLLQQYCLISPVLLANRQQLYHPSQPLLSSYSVLLQKSPSSVQVISLYAFYRQSLSIKYFFASVIQIFQVVTVVIYLFTISLIMKQIYQEKEIQVGIWRTLGAGGVKQLEHSLFANTHLQQKITKNGILNQRLTFTQKLFYYHQILVKIGFVNYWLVSSIISIMIYMLLKYILIGLICVKLNFMPISQSYSTALILFMFVFLICTLMATSYIYQIYTSPLALIIKPLKRTFDQVKIRIIHLSTFGLSSETLLISLMLVYYGVVSYYWIPFAILDNDGDLQVTLFNSIFVGMIFGAIMLLAVMQSRLERFLLKVIFLFNNRFNRMSVIMLKNIKAKQYKNIKMSIIIAVTFAFLLFFSTGINIQIQIVESFIERTLGASLVLQNYQKKSFNVSAIQLYLKSIPQIKHSWISSDINSQGIQISLINQMDPIRKTFCQFKVLTPQYLQSTFSQYYYPQDYIQTDKQTYRKLPNNVYDGFDSIYEVNGVNHTWTSTGRFNPNDTMGDFDQNKINVGEPGIFVEEFNMMAPQEQVVNFAASTLLKLQLGAKVGDLYKMRLKSDKTMHQYNIRSRIVHSYKIGPGMDLIRPQAFISQQQARFIQRILGHNETIRYQKLLISGTPQSLNEIGLKLLSISPEHTQMYQMSLVSQSFHLLSSFLSSYIVLISVIMGSLAVLFIFLSTLNKLKQQSSMYKMLRAIGLSVSDIRLMIFLEVFIRLIVSIVNGMLLGIVFSLGFAMQIQEFLMINTQGLDLTLITQIAITMFIVFCVTVVYATKDLKFRTVNQTQKI